MTATPHQKGRTPPPPIDDAPVTTAKEFAAGIKVRLPGCGHTVRLRKPSLRALIVCGKVPNKFGDSVYRQAQGVVKNPDISPEEQRQRFLEESSAFVYVAAECFVSPKMVLDRAPNYDANEIGPDDISDVDHIFLFYTWTEGSVETDNPFRVDPISFARGAGDAGLAGEALQPAA